MDICRQILLHIGIEILFEFKGLGILMVDFGAFDRAFIGTALIGKDNVLLMPYSSAQIAGKGSHRRKWRMAIEIALLV